MHSTFGRFTPPVVLTTLDLLVVEAATKLMRGGFPRRAMLVDLALTRLIQAEPSAEPALGFVPNLERMIATLQALLDCR